MIGTEGASCKVSSQYLIYFIPGLNDAGEASGDWVCIPLHEPRRLDVQVVGILSLPTKISPAMAALEGKFGRLLLARPVTADVDKVMVYGVGKNGTKHNVPKQCIKPRRTVEDGTSLTKTRARVVIVGPDVTNDAIFKGYYAETQPTLEHSHGADVVGVSLEPSMLPGVGGAPVFFHITSLCYAANVRLMSPDGDFPTTNFV